MSKEDYKVGYGKPPKEHQFKKGQSGNPRGRPKRDYNLGESIRYYLSQKVTVRENGDLVKLPFMDLIAYRLVTTAAKGKPSEAMKALYYLKAECPEMIEVPKIPQVMRIEFVESNGYGQPAGTDPGERRRFDKYLNDERSDKRAASNKGQALNKDVPTDKLPTSV